MISSKAISLKEVSEALGLSDRTIRRRLKGKKGNTILFDTWRAIDTNPDGVKRQWIFEKIEESQMAA